MGAVHVLSSRGVHWGLLAALTCKCELACAPSPRNDVATTRAAIVGGQLAEPGQYPTVAWLDGGCSAVFVHPEVLVYAGHCGDDHSVAWLGDKVKLDGHDSSTVTDPLEAVAIELAKCSLHPDVAYGTGTDIAYCLTRASIEPKRFAPPLHSCERALLDESGFRARLVGFGATKDDIADGGAKRWVEASGVWYPPEFLIGDEEAGTCYGDSGGPAFTRIVDSERLLGVLSSGVPASCGVGWYTDVSQHVDWLERETQRELSPCTDERGEWLPSPACRRAILDDTMPDLPASSCGQGYVMRTIDETAPRFLDVIGYHADGGWHLEVDVEDAGEGVQRVAVYFESEATPVAVDEIPPFSFASLKALGRRRVKIEALDYSGNSAVTTVHLRRAGGGCSISRERGSHGLSFMLWWVIITSTRARTFAPRPTLCLDREV